MKQDQWFVKPKTGLDISGNGLINLITFCVLFRFPANCQQFGGIATTPRALVLCLVLL